MKTILTGLFVATVLASVTLANSVSAAPVPLRPGVYHGGGSQYIAILKKGKRYCYVGMSKHGVGYVSLVTVPKHPNIYRMSKFGDSYNTYLIQTSRTTVTFETFRTLKEAINNNLTGGHTLDSTNTLSVPGTNQDNVDDNHLRNDPYLRQCFNAFNSRKPFFISIPNR